MGNLILGLVGWLSSSTLQISAVTEGSKPIHRPKVCHEIAKTSSTSRICECCILKNIEMVLGTPTLTIVCASQLNDFFIKQHTYKRHVF